mmetsp:Transcript_7068/g.12824  ORF Transcript_7068/g.12824 Transcript_7068/m.12824 type:complete len:211 (+) Transcript_7068:1035-1667(+)
MLPLITRVLLGIAAQVNINELIVFAVLDHPGVVHTLPSGHVTELQAHAFVDGRVHRLLALSSAARLPRVQRAHDVCVQLPRFCQSPRKRYLAVLALGHRAGLHHAHSVVRPERALRVQLDLEIAEEGLVHESLQCGEDVGRVECLDGFWSAAALIQLALLFNQSVVHGAFCSPARLPACAVLILDAAVAVALLRHPSTVLLCRARRCSSA